MLISSRKLATVNKRNKKSPSWSDFHFPPPPSDIYGINESTTMEPLLLPKIPVSPVVPIVRNIRDDHIRSKKISADDSLHYATAAVRIPDFKVKRRIEKFHMDQIVLGCELGRGRFTVIRSCSINGNNYAAKIITDRNKQTM
ncbi:unnamed protein product [Brugia timori]|uniref:Protein kinase domain-containing protein n=1 Tax=Brugia timori TaxID=42155 RepID=A0A3P7X579_9BILA|nr:unnamed protein product [Brugia timori]